MTDRVHPSAKTTATNPPFPATKSNLSAANRPTYRPQPPHRRRHSRGCFCTLCCYLLLILIFIFILIAAAGTVFYFLYHPHRPTFSVTSLKLSSLNPTATTANFDLTLTTTNPNDKIIFSYASTTVSLLSVDTALATATIPAFRHQPKNTTVLEASVTITDAAAESDAAMELKRSVKRKSEVVAVKVKLETKVEAQISLFQTPRVGITVLCDGVNVSLGGGEKPATGDGDNTECKVDVRFKVWKWTLG